MIYIYFDENLCMLRFNGESVKCIFDYGRSLEFA